MMWTSSRAPRLYHWTLATAWIVSTSGALAAPKAQATKETSAPPAKAAAAPVATEASRPGEPVVIRRQQVEAAAATGQRLMEAKSFSVLSLRRDKPGQAEIHELDTDVAFVLEGSATLVTGGTAVEAKTTEPNELRGASIVGGHEEVVTAGDVLVIPKGVPHWFKNVVGVFRYHLVKVR